MRSRPQKYSGELGRGLILAWCGLVLSVVSSLATAANPIAAEALGARIYHEGRGLDGEPLKAHVQGDVPLPAAANACVQCHRRSGLGVGEGGQRSAPITAAHLFTALEGRDARPAYSTDSLTAAVNGGYSPAGRPLSPLMPRYRLAPAEIRALEAYLKTLGQDADPGIDHREVVIATIIATSAPVAEREANRRVLTQFVARKNAGTRHEERRAEQARRHPYGERADRHWRRWRLQVWELSGDPSTWTAQLDAYQRRDPAFAVVGGTAGRDWDTVHQYCETRRLPCLLPIADTVRPELSGWYSLYLNDGVALEARMTARAIAGSAEAGRQSRVLVVHDDSAAGRMAWKSLLAAWPDDGRALPREQILSRGRSQGTAEWQALLAAELPDLLIAWVDPEHLGGLLAPSLAPFLPARIYSAETFTNLLDIPADSRWRSRWRHLYPWRLPVDARQPFPREQAWLRSNGLDDLDARLAGRVLFACHVFGEALGNLRGNFSREYLMESLEHMLDGSDMTTLLPRTSLGPGRRVLSRGAYVLAFAPSGGTAPPPLWLE